MLEVHFKGFDNYATDALTQWDTNQKIKITGLDEYRKSSLESDSYMANAYLDFMPNYWISPYISGGIGWTSLKLTNQDEDAMGTRESYKENNFTWTAGGGLTFRLNRCLNVDFGYRYFSTYAPERVSYPFGYGLSYTDFDWTEASIGRFGREYVVTLRVTNTGEFAGREVVELYVAAPKGDLVKPIRELRAFAKSRELRPGESELLTLRFASDDLASFDERISAFVVAFGARSSVRKVHDVLKPREFLQTFEY